MMCFLTKRNARSLIDSDTTPTISTRICRSAPGRVPEVRERHRVLIFRALVGSRPRDQEEDRVFATFLPTFLAAAVVLERLVMSLNRPGLCPKRVATSRCRSL